MPPAASIDTARAAQLQAVLSSAANLSPTAGLSPGVLAQPVGAIAPAGSLVFSAVALLPQVRPGDLITADLLNALVAVLRNLETRIAALETSGATLVVSITAISGPTAPVRVRSRITVSGTSFATPAVLNTVTLDGVPVTSFSASDSTATQLVFDVPQVPGLPQSGRPVHLLVANANGTATFDFLLAPEVQGVSGTIQAGYAVAPALASSQPTIQPGQSYVFIYRLTAFASGAARYLVQPTVSGTGWTAQVLADDSDQPTDGTVDLPGAISGATRDVRLKVTLPAGATAAALNVAVSSPENPLVDPGFASPLTISPGAPPPVPDNRVLVSLVTTPGADGRILFTRGTAQSVAVNVAVTQQGSYTVAAAMRNAAGWSAPLLDTPSFQVKSDPLSGQAVNTPVSARFVAGAAAGATDLVFTVSRGTDLSVQFAIPVAVQGGTSGQVLVGHIVASSA